MCCMVCTKVHARPDWGKEVGALMTMAAGAAFRVYSEFGIWTLTRRLDDESAASPCQGEASYPRVFSGSESRHSPVLYLSRARFVPRSRDLSLDKERLGSD